MTNLDDHFITENTPASIKEVNFKLGNDEFIAGIRDIKTVTWRDYRAMSEKYMNIDTDDPDESTVEMTEGDANRYLFFIQYIQDTENGRQNFTVHTIDQMPVEFYEQIEQYIPQQEDVMGSIKPGLKKKLQKSLKKAKKKNRSRSKTKS